MGLRTFISLWNLIGLAEPIKPMQMGPRNSVEDVDKDDKEEEDSETEYDDGEREEDTPEHEMEYCDPCYCYGKCCLDIVASIFCVSLL